VIGPLLSLLLSVAPADAPVAMVDGVSITSTAFKRAFAPSKRQLAAQGMALDLVRMMGFDRRVLEQLIDTQLLEVAAANRGVKVSDEVVRAELDSLKVRAHFDQAAYLAFARESEGSVERFETAIRRRLGARELLETAQGGVTVSQLEVHDRCRSKTDLAVLSSVRFPWEDARADVKLPTNAVLFAWAKAHEAEVSERFARLAVPLVRRTNGRGLMAVTGESLDVPDPLTPLPLFAWRQDHQWHVGDEQQLRIEMATALYREAQAPALARRDAERALAALKKGKTLDAQFPGSVSHSMPFSALDTAGSMLSLAPPVIDEIFARQTPGPLSSVVTDGEGERVIAVVKREPLNERTCARGAASWRAELLAEKQEKARAAFLAELRAKATITIDELALSGAVEAQASGSDTENTAPLPAGDSAVTRP
jgi:SurA N-terminal domain